MAPALSRWDDEEDSTPPSSPPAVAAVARRGKFDDEEDAGDVAESWDAEDDSEAEAEKAKVAAERKAKAEAEAAANKKSKSQRLANHQAARKAQKEAEEEETSSEEEDSEDEVEKRERLRKTEQDADLKHAQDLLGDVGISNKRSAAPKTVVVVGDSADAKSSESSTIDLSSLALFKPKSKDEFEKMTQVLVPLITNNSRHPQYSLTFLPEFVKGLARDLPSSEVKKLSSVIALLLNEKLKEEKAADKGGKKSKAAKTKTSLVANRDTAHKADVTAYDDGMEDDDFM